MSSAGRCIARSTSSGMVVGPGMARNSRPARTVIVGFPLVDGHGCRLTAGISRCRDLFLKRIGYAVPDLILQLGRGRARNHGDGRTLLVAILGKPHDPHLAVGEIGIAAA